MRHTVFLLFFVSLVLQLFGVVNVEAKLLVGLFVAMWVAGSLHDIAGAVEGIRGKDVERKEKDV